MVGWDERENEPFRMVSEGGEWKLLKDKNYPPYF